MRYLVIILLFITSILSAQTGGERNRVFHPLQLDPDFWLAPDLSRYTLNTDTDTLYDLSSNRRKGVAISTSYNAQLKYDEWGNPGFYFDAATVDQAINYVFSGYVLSGDFTIVACIKKEEWSNASWNRLSFLGTIGTYSSDGVYLIVSDDGAANTRNHVWLGEYDYDPGGNTAAAMAVGDNRFAQDDTWLNATRGRIYRHWRNRGWYDVGYINAFATISEGFVGDGEQTAPLNIGSLYQANNASEGYEGFIYEIQIYHRVLSTAELDQIFEYFEDRYMRGTGFNPERYADSLYVYVDYSDASTITETSGNITSIADKSSQGYTFTRDAAVPNQTPADYWVFDKSNYYRGYAAHSADNTNVAYESNESAINEILNGDTVTYYTVHITEKLETSHSGYLFSTVNSVDGGRDGFGAVDQGWSTTTKQNAWTNYVSDTYTNISGYGSNHYSDNTANTTNDSLLSVYGRVMYDYALADDATYGKLALGTKLGQQNNVEGEHLALLIFRGEHDEATRNAILHELAFQYGNSDYNSQITPWTPWDYRDNIIGWYDFTETNSHENPNDYSINFDGTNDHIYADAPFCPTLDSTFTISYWFNADVLSGTRHMLTFGTSEGTGDASEAGTFAMRLNGSALETFHYKTDGSLWSHGVVSTSQTLSTGTWYHYGVIYDGNSITIYRDGTLIQTIASADLGTVCDIEKILMGARKLDAVSGFAGIPWDGKLDEFAFWDTNLSSTDIQSLANGTFPLELATAPIAYYDFEDGNGSTAIDKVGSANGTFANFANPNDAWTLDAPYDNEVQRVRDISGTSGDAYNDHSASMLAPDWEASVNNVSLQTSTFEGFLIDGAKYRDATELTVFFITDQSSHGGENIQYAFGAHQGSDSGVNANRQAQWLISGGLIGYTNVSTTGTTNAGVTLTGSDSENQQDKTVYCQVVYGNQDPALFHNGTKYNTWSAAISDNILLDALGPDDDIKLGSKSDGAGDYKNAVAIGYVAIVALDKALTDAEVQQWTNWLINYYGIEK